MATEREYQSLYDRIAALRETMVSRLSADLIQNPQLADALTKQIDEMLENVVEADMAATPPPDKGLAELVGVGHKAATELGQTRIPPGVQVYDETVTSERIIAVGDLYYIYQHERIGVFRVMQKLQELFKAGAVQPVGRAGRLCALPVRPPRGVALHPARPPGRLSARLRLWQRAGAAQFAGQHRLPSSVHALCQPGDALLARQADLRRDPRAGLRSQLWQHRHRAPGRAGPAQQSQVHVVWPSERACASR